MSSCEQWGDTLFLNPFGGGHKFDAQIEFHMVGSCFFNQASLEVAGRLFFGNAQKQNKAKT